MKHEPVPPPHREPFSFKDDGSDEALSDFLMSIPPCPELPSTPEEIAASDARAAEDAASGRVYSHEIVGEWLKTWGQADQVPFRKWLASRNG